MGDSVRKLAEILGNAGKKHIKVQTAWATVKEVDWEAKTMVATGVADALDYLDVSLGIGAVYRKPKAGTRCLLGIIEDNVAATFLIDAGELEELTIESTVKTNLKSVETVFNSGDFGGLVKIQELKENLDQLKSFTEAIHSSLPGAFTAIGAGSAAAGTSGANSYSGAMTGQSIQFQDMENKKVKH